MKLEDMEKILKQETSCFSDFDIDSFVKDIKKISKLKERKEISLRFDEIKVKHNLVSNHKEWLIPMFIIWLPCAEDYED